MEINQILATPWKETKCIRKQWLCNKDWGMYVKCHEKIIFPPQTQIVGEGKKIGCADLVYVIILQYKSLKGLFIAAKIIEDTVKI